MFGHGYFGSGYYGPGYFGPGVSAPVEPVEQDFGVAGSGASGPWLYPEYGPLRVVSERLGRFAMGLRMRQATAFAGRGIIDDLRPLRFRLACEALDAYACTRAEANPLRQRLKLRRTNTLAEWLEDPLEELLLLGLYDPRGD